jgi:hypothetical protein
MVLEPNEILRVFRFFPIPYHRVLVACSYFWPSIGHLEIPKETERNRANITRILPTSFRAVPTASLFLTLLHSVDNEITDSSSLRQQAPFQRYFGSCALCSGRTLRRERLCWPILASERRRLCVDFKDEAASKDTTSEPEQECSERGTRLAVPPSSPGTENLLTSRPH